MRTSDFTYFINTQGDRIHIKGDYIYRGLCFHYTLNEQAGSAMQQKEFRGRMTVISPFTGHPMYFQVNHPYATRKEKQKTKKKHREISSHKGVRRDDTEQMCRMMQRAVDSQDYRKQLIKNCVTVLYPSDRRDEDKIIPLETAVMCAEALGKRSFILEVLPATALELAIDRRIPEKQEKKAWWKFW